MCTGLFSYFNIIVLPWRLSIAAHMCECFGRASDPGRDFYGRSTEAVWFHIPRMPRLVIICCLLASTACHFANQISRFVYQTYELSDTFPGVLVCNATFGGAVLFGLMAGVVQLAQEKTLRRQHPERYPPGVVAHVLDLKRRGELSIIQLLCCRLNALSKSHEDERQKWHVERERGALRPLTARRPTCRLVPSCERYRQPPASAPGASPRRQPPAPARSGPTPLPPRPKYRHASHSPPHAMPLRARRSTPSLRVALSCRAPVAHLAAGRGHCCHRHRAEPIASRRTEPHQIATQPERAFATMGTGLAARRPDDRARGL